MKSKTLWKTDMMPSIRIGSVEIAASWVMLLVGAVGMFIYIWQRKRLYSLSGCQCVGFTLALTLVGVLGAKLLFVLENWQAVVSNGLTFNGVSFFGSVLLISLLMPLLGRLFHLRNGQTLDLCGPCVAIMIGCMRIGCFLGGCCGGWIAQFGNLSFQWPTQAVESIMDFVILAVLMQWEAKGKFQKLLYPLFMLLYSAMRFFVEFFRDTPKDWLLLSRGQWYSLVALVVAGIWLALAQRKRVKLWQ